MPGADMTIKNVETNQTDDTTRQAFAPIQRDLLERLTRECESQAGAPWDQPMLVSAQPVPTARTR